MTVQNTVRSISYETTGGAGVVYALSGLQFPQNASIQVFLDGERLTEGPDYSLLGAGNQLGGQLTLINDPGAGLQLLITRVVNPLQQTDYTATDSFPAEAHERALDKLTLIAQGALLLDQDDARQFDAMGLQIADVADPDDDQDAATRKYVNDRIAAASDLGENPAPDASDVTRKRALRAAVLDEPATFQDVFEVPTPTAGDVAAGRFFRARTGTGIRDDAHGEWVDLDLPAAKATNYLINGDFRIGQRGFTLAAVPTLGFHLDRWYLLSDAAPMDISMATAAADVPAGAYRALKCTVPVGSENKQFGHVQIIEAAETATIVVNPIGGAALRFSARVNSDRTIRAAVVAWDGTEDSPTKNMVLAWNANADFSEATDWTIEASAQFNATTSFQTFTIENIAFDQPGTKNIAVFIWSDNPSTAAGDYLIIGNVQLEAGGTSNEFSPRPVQQELALCQRFYVTSYDEGVTPGEFPAPEGMLSVSGTGNGAGFVQLDIRFPVRMRITPTCVIYNPLTGTLNEFQWNAVGAAAAASSDPGTSGFRVINTAAGILAGDRFHLHYTASAEF